MEPELISFGYHQSKEVKTFFLFNDVMLPSNAEVTTFQFNIGFLTECLDCDDFTAIAYLLVSQQKSFTDQFKSLNDNTPKLSNADYMTFLFNGTKNNTSNSNSIDFLDLFYKVSNKYLGLVKDLGIIIKPDLNLKNENLFKFSRSGIVLTIAYRIKGFIHFMFFFSNLLFLLFF